MANERVDSPSKTPVIQIFKSKEGTSPVKFCGCFRRVKRVILFEERGTSPLRLNTVKYR